ncbi:MAG: sigma-54-dependent transcriptional regulator [Myxococcota bacterium]
MANLQTAAELHLSDLAGDTVRVLVVDDDSVLARAIQRVLCVRGFDVDTALDGHAALDRLERQRYDVMLLDMQMADMDGMEVFRAANERNAPPATIIHSAHIDVRTAVMATRAGVHEVMQKPVAEEILAARIRELAVERRIGHAGARAKALGPPDTSEALLRLVGGSSATNELREHIRRVAHFRDLSVLVQGPTGTGKELVAQAIHAVTCPGEPFVSVNCAAVPEELFESELFGHEAGAFTNAKACRVGLFEEAGKGTLFLDEIGEMPLSLQAKLLRVLEIRQFRRLGGTRTRVLAARIISATNRATFDLRSSMRADLFFRLAGYTIRTPALTEHVSDIPELARHFLYEFEKRHHVGNKRFAPSALAALLSYTWPGNVRELRGVVENACILARNGVIERREIEAALQARSDFAEPGRDSERALQIALQSAPPPAVPESSEASPSSAREPVALPSYASLPALQRDVILRAFEDSNRNLTRAALQLGIPRTTLRARLKRYGVR